MLDAGKINEKLPSFAQTLEHRHSAIGWEKQLEKTAEMMIHLGFNPTLTAGNLGSIDIPVRLSLGDRDTMVSLTETAEVFKILQKGELQVLPSTQHPLEKLDPSKILPSLIEFFSS